MFDHITAGIIKQDAKGMVLQLKNETIHDASVTLFAETSVAAMKPLGYNNFTKWPKAGIKAGEAVKVWVGKNGEVTVLGRA